MTGTKVYVAMVHDRHADPGVEVFTTADAAIGYARGLARRLAWRQEDIEEKPGNGRLYCARYSEEGDSVWVEEKTIDEPDEED